MKAKLAVYTVLAVLAVHCLCGAATAAWGGCFSSYYAVTPWAYAPGNTYLHLRNTIPYFALHPPVYYSRPVERPYGLSPYADFPGPVPPAAYRLGVGTANVPRPVRPSPKPLKIVNPYVVQSKDAPEPVEAIPSRQPQVLRPSSLY